MSEVIRRPADSGYQLLLLPYCEFSFILPRLRDKGLAYPYLSMCQDLSVSETCLKVALLLTVFSLFSRYCRLFFWTMTRTCPKIYLKSEGCEPLHDGDPRSQ